MKLNPHKLGYRTLRSFIVMAAVALLLVTSWFWARRQLPVAPLVDEIPLPFRQVLEWNGRLWHGLLNVHREVVAIAPPIGRRPRVNGDIGLESAVDLTHWKMTVVPNADASEVEASSIELSMNDIRAMPRTETSTEFRCIEGWSEPISYVGVRFSDFLKTMMLGTHTRRDWDPTHPGVDTFRYVGLETPDGAYYVSVDMESMLHPQTVLAYEMNGKPLDGPNGAPLRLIIPIKYGVKSLKRIGRIFFSDHRPPDYWAEQGYDWFAGL